MTPKELAEKLNGSEYPLRLSKDIISQAKADGLVIVYGASDDLIEFSGAIDDEIGAWGGMTTAVDAEGIIPQWEDIEDNDRHDLEFMRDYFKREGGGKIIEALWASDGEYSWTYRTDIPHETFDITKDGVPYCRGIVFALADIDGALANG